MNKRTLIKASVALTANSIFPIKKLFAKEQNKDNFKANDMTINAVPIGSEERRKRVKKAQNIMKQNLSFISSWIKISVMHLKQ